MRPSSKPASLATTAHAYATQLGWPVFPLRPGAKTPMTRNGFLDATTDPNTITHWWQRAPDANIGLPTGQFFDVLDVDGPPGVEALNHYLHMHYHHPGPIASTGKGWHLLFAPTNAHNATNLVPKVDFRGAGGYIVAPPSLHPSGDRYAWLPGRGPTLPLPPAPTWLTKLLQRDDNLIHPTIPLTAPIDPNKPALDYLQLVHDQAFPKDQLPRGLRTRSERPSILDACAQQGIHLRRAGANYMTNCLFHDDSTPSMTIYPANNTFHCFGCSAHGDSYDLLNDPPTHI